MKGRRGRIRWVATALGAVLVATGAVWIAQGAGVLHGSFMTGSTFWTKIGILAVVVGLVLAWGAFRLTRTRR